MKLKNIIINKKWNFGEFGWRYVAEPLIPILEEISNAFFELKKDKSFINNLKKLHKNYIWRPSPLVYAKNLTQKLGWAEIFLKNEWVNHTWAHKINHCVGQALLAKYLGKKRIIAETWAGQHGLATASICAKLWLECTIYMWYKDYKRQMPNVIYMQQAWAEVIPVYEWNQSLRDAVNAALKDLINHSNKSHYLLGTTCGPHPYPSMNAFFQKIIGEEAKKQLRTYYKTKTKINPDYLISCVWGGSNSIGLFYDFLDENNVNLIGVEAWGKWTNTKYHASRFTSKKIWFVEWYKSYFLQDQNWQVKDTYSISAWLDYSWVSPQLAYLEKIWRVKITSATDQEALEATKTLMKTEWILPALESAHWLAEVIKLAPQLDKSQKIICNISWRGDKDLFITAPKLSSSFNEFLENFLKNKT